MYMLKQKMSSGISIGSDELVHRIGEDGKDGKTFVVQLKKRESGNCLSAKYTLKARTKIAVKTFKQTKSINMITKESKFQQQAFLAGVSPQIYGVQLAEKYLCMQLLDSLPANTYKNNTLPDSLQYMICALMVRLDNIEVLHGDMNPLNVMLSKNGRPYLIDFGFAKSITRKITRDFGAHPNITVSLRGLSMGFSRHKVSVPIIDDCVQAAGNQLSLDDWIQKGERFLSQFD